MEEQAKKSFIINIIFIFMWVGIIFVAGKFLLQYLLPFVIALLVAAIMQKFAGRLSDKLHFKKGTCAAILSAALYIGIAAVLVFVIFKIVKFTGTAVSLLSTFSEEVSEFMAQAQEIFAKIFSNISPEMGETGKKILTDLLSSVVERISSFLSGTAADIVKTAPSFLFSSVVALAATCYIAKDFDGLINFVKGLIKEKTVKNFGRVTEILKTCVLKMITGYLILMLLTFLELLLGLLILRVKSAVLIALIIAVIDILPILGAGAVLLPWGILSIILGNTSFGIGIMVLYLCITIIRNFAEPKIVGSKMGIDPLFILLAMFLGLRLFGFVGLIILPVTLIVIIKYYKSEMEQETS